MQIGSFTLTRDSALWWFGLIGAVVVAVATLSADMAADFGIPASWLPKLRLGAFLIGVGSAWAKTSPFPKKNETDGGKVDVTKLAPIVLLAVMLSGCAVLAGTRHRATVSVVTAHAVLSAVQDGEALLVCGRPTAPAPPRCVSADAHKAVSAKLVTAFDYDIKVAQLVRALPANASSPDVATMLGQITALVDAVFKLIPESSERTTLAAKVGAR